MSKQQKLLEVINKIVDKKNSKLISELKSDLHLRNDLGFDSLDLAELTVRIEKEFGIDIFEDGIVNTIGEVLTKLNMIND